MLRNALVALVCVEEARSGCTLGDCLLSVTTASTISADQLGEVMRQARSVAASTTDIEVGSARLSFGEQCDGSTDLLVAALAAGVRDLPQVTNLQIEQRPEAFNVELRIDGPRADLGDTARSVWDDLEAIPARSLTATSDDGNGSFNRLTASGSFPQASVDFVRGFEEVNLLTAAAIGAVRRDLSEVGDTVPVTVALDDGVTIELGTTGSPDLPGLAKMIIGASDVSVLEIDTPDEKDEPKPPSSLGRGTPEQIDLGIRAWRVGG